MISLEFCGFGAVAVIRDGAEVGLGSTKQRILLAALLSRANEAVSTSDLLDTVWPTHRPRTARKNLQIYVSNLRKIVGGRLRFTRLGYLLSADPDEYDILRFRQLESSGRRALRVGDIPSAKGLLSAAVAGWTAEPFAEFGDVPLIAAEVEALRERFIAAYEDWVELRIVLGEHAAVLESLDGMARRHPFRERLAQSRMIALARSGRSAEALAHYDAVRRALASELGIEPSPAMRALYLSLLAGDVGAVPVSGAGVPVPAGLSAELPRRGQLPRMISDFVGREAELGRLVEDLSSVKRFPDVVVVSGPVGAGKTTLAIRVAHETTETFTDGVVLVDAHPIGDRRRTVAELADDLLRGAGISPDALDPAIDLTVFWRSWVSDRRLLIILDNVAYEADVRALMPTHGRSRVVVTSRSRLGGLESTLRVPLAGFDRSDGLEFMELLVGRERIAADHGAADRLIHECGGLPLAIRIVCAKLALLRHVSITDFADRVSNDFTIDDFAIGDVSVRDGYDQFFGGLAPEQRAALIRLAEAPRPIITQTQIAEVLGTTAAEQHRLVESLIECGFLTVPSYDVVAHSATFEVPRLAYRYVRELVDRGQWMREDRAGAITPRSGHSRRPGTR